jgi:hypothetical protein
MKVKKRGGESTGRKIRKKSRGTMTRDRARGTILVEEKDGYSVSHVAKARPVASASL